MGIKDLTTYIKKQFPNCYEETSISNLGLKNCSVDYKLLISKFIKATTHDKEKVIKLLNNFIDKFDNLGINLYFINDGKCDPLKYDTQIKRIKTRNKNQENKCNKILTEINNHFKVEDIELPQVEELTISFEDIKIYRDINICEDTVLNDCIKKYEKAVIDGLPPVLSKQDMIDIENIIREKSNFIQAIQEGEKCCSDLVYHNIMDACISSDSDCIASLCPLTIVSYSIDINDIPCKIIRSQKVLEEMKLSPEQFTDFCILLGTDYNSRVNKMGPVNSYRLICRYKSIENIIKYENNDYSCLIDHSDEKRKDLKRYQIVRDLIMPCENPNYSII